mgnify:CR=1 FL=1
MGNYLSFRRSFFSEYNYQRINFSEYELEINDKIKGRLIYGDSGSRFHYSHFRFNDRWEELPRVLLGSCNPEAKIIFDFVSDEMYEKARHLVQSIEQENIEKNDIFRKYARYLYEKYGYTCTNDGSVYLECVLCGKIEITTDEFRRPTALFKLF